MNSLWLNETLSSNFPTSMPLENATIGVASVPDARQVFIQTVRSDPLYQAHKLISAYKVYFLMAISLIGNGLSLYAVRHRINKNSSCFYIGNLAVCDILYIWSKGIYYIMTRERIFGTWACRILNYIINASLMYSVWLVVLMTAERFLAVLWPLKISSWINMTRARVAVALLYVTFATLNIMYLFAVQWEPLPLGVVYTCNYMPEYKAFFSKIWPFIDMSIYAYIPLILIFVLNISIILSLGRARNQQAEMRGDSRGSGESGGQVTAMLLTVSITAFVLICPYTILYIYIQLGLWDYRANGHTFAIYSLSLTLTNLLAELNHCINFLLYVATGKRFRQEIKKLCCCIRPRGNSGTTSRTGTSLSTISVSLSRRGQKNASGAINMRI